MNVDGSAKTVLLLAASVPHADLKRQMELCDIRVLWAQKINDAAALLHSEAAKPIVVSELALQDGNWRDVLDMVKSIDTSISVLLLSSEDSPELWWDALECGIEDILRTPVAAAEFCEYLQKQFATGRLMEIANLPAANHD